MFIVKNKIYDDFAEAKSVAYWASLVGGIASVIDQNGNTLVEFVRGILQ